MEFSGHILLATPRTRLYRLVSFLDSLRLQTKISLFVLLGLVVILGLFTWLGVSAVKQSTAQILQDRLALADATASYVDEVLADSIFHLKKTTAFASFDPKQGNLADEFYAVSFSYSQIEDYAQGVLLLDPHGVVVLGTPQGMVPRDRDMSSEPYVRQAIESGRAVVSNAFRHPTTNLPTVAAVTPVTNDKGEIVGYLSAFLDLESPRFTKLLDQSVRFTASGHGDVIDGDGNVVVSSSRDDLLVPGDHPEFYMRLMATRSSGVETALHREGSHHSNLPARPDERHVMAFVPLKNAPWGIGIGASEDETFAAVWREQNQATILAAVSIALALLFAYLTTRRVVGPIEALTAASERMASGDLASPITAKGSDEVGRLAVSFDQMRSKVQTAYSALTVEKSRYQGIFRSMADPVFTVDPLRRVTSLNPAAERMIGCTEAEAIGLSCVDILRSRNHRLPTCFDRCPLLDSADQNAGVDGLGDGNSSGSVEMLYAGRGTLVTVDTTRAPILNDDGEMVGVVHVLRDISAKEELDRMKDRLLSNVSHELRSPLGYIKGYASTLLRRDVAFSPRDQQKFVREILQGSEKVQRIVDELLDTSRLQTQTFPIKAWPIKIGPIIGAAAKWARAQSRPHKVIVHTLRGLPTVMADPLRTEQVLRNLLENAIKYSPDGGTILISWSIDQDKLIVSISDQGIGVAADQLDMIFEPFHRVSSDLAIQVGGVGLGLSICRSIVESQGGKIWADSAPGEGSTFRFSIPITS